MDTVGFVIFNNSNIFYLINIYSNNNQLALKYLKDTETNIHNFLVMTDGFNIKDSDWNFSYPFHLVYSDLLIDIVDLFDFIMS